MPMQRPSEVPDAELVARVLAGEREEYAELVRRYQEPLYRHALGMLGSPDAAADVTQESLIRAYTRLRSCHEPDRFGPWTFRILRNRCLDYLKDRRRNTVSIEDESILGASETDAAVSLEQEELREAVFKALDQLPPAQKEAFLLKHVEDLSYDEMTELLGASVSALKMRVKRAREALQDLLTAKRGEEL
jgi:RNA polymerase sigma-70 factor, ECF subfamily